MDFPRPFEEIVYRLCEDVNTPRALTVSLLVRTKEYRQLFSLKTDPAAYTSPEDYFRDTLVTDFCRKLDVPGVIPREELEAECWDRFERTERTCHETNLRLRRFIDGGMTPSDLPILPILDNIRKIIRQICGPLPRSISGGFGPGATLTNSSRLCTVPDKLTTVLSGTASANYLLSTLFSESRWMVEDTELHQGRSFTVARGNRFFTVPKEAMKLRGACLSPVINGFLQKGVGEFLRTRLRTVGIEIEGKPLARGLFSVNELTTPDLHRRIAKRASLDGEYATIDLSDASNTIAFQLIRLLFPEDWFLLLNDLRERVVERPDGRYQHLEMFSAMGNGFTFEVETIVFYAIVKAVTGGRGFVSVFGDDIIVPTEAARDCLAALRWFGFTPNQTKTFIGGPFRESCGGDFYRGTPVRAHFVKELPNAPEKWIALANGLRKLAYGDPSTHHRWRYLRRCWFSVLDNIPSHIRLCRGPAELGDLVIHDEERTWNYRESNSQRLFRVYRPVQRPVSWKHFKPGVHFLSALYGVPSSGAIPRNSVSGYRISWIPFS